MPKKKKETFVFRISWQEVLMGYPSEVRLEVYDAIVEYVASGTLPKLKPLANMAFSFIRRDIDADDARYAETVQRRAEAGRKGMQARWSSDSENNNKSNNDNKSNDSYQDITNVTNITTITNITDNDYDNDYDLKEENILKEENNKGNKNNKSNNDSKCYCPTLEDCYNELITSEIWAEDVIREKYRLGISLNADTLKQLLDIFFGELKCRDTPPRDVRTTKEHFSNWLNTYYEKKKQHEKRDSNSRTAYTSKQEANDYALQQFISMREAREQGVAAEVAHPF